VAAQSLYNNASMRFTARNARFLFKEMEEQPNTENCSPVCFNPYKINGAIELCNSATNYFIHGLPRGATVVWGVSPQNLVTSTVIGNVLRLQRIANANGMLTITATISNACNSPYTASLIISVGTQAPANYSICGYNPNDGCRYPKLLFAVNTIYPAGHTYSWYINNVLMATTTTPSWTYNLEPPCDVYLEASVIVTGPCGPSNPAGETIYYACNEFGRNSLLLSPNPTTSTVTAELKGSTTSIAEIRILNKNGGVEKAIKGISKTNKATIDLGYLPADIYYISVFDGQKWITGKVIKN
jgi:hypothetical protein